MITRKIFLSTAMICMLALPAAAQDEGGGAAPQPQMGGGAGMGQPGMQSPDMPPGMGMPGMDPQAMMGMMQAAGDMMGLSYLTGADANRDGAVTKAEWDAVFDKMDPNHDGTISREEMETMKKAQMERMQQMRAEMMQHMPAIRKMQGMGGPAAGGPGTGADSPSAMPQGAPAQ